MTEPQEVNGFVYACGLLAPFAAFCVFLSPLPTIRRMQAEQKTGNLPLLPYTTMILNTLIWNSYGFLVEEPRIWLCNGAGLILGSFYYSAFIQYCPKLSRSLPGTVSQHHYSIAATLLFLFFLLLVLNQPAPIIGNLGVLFTIALFASPLAALKVVLETKSSRSIPLPFTIASILNCFLWSVFGWWQAKDANVYIPNIVGLLFALVQLGLKLHFEPTVLLQQLTTIVPGMAMTKTPTETSSNSSSTVESSAKQRKPIVMV